MMLEKGTITESTSWLLYVTLRFNTRAPVQSLRRIFSHLGKSPISAATASGGVPTYYGYLRLLQPNIQRVTLRSKNPTPTITLTMMTISVSESFKLDIFSYYLCITYATVTNIISYKSHNRKPERKEARALCFAG